LIEQNIGGVFLSGEMGDADYDDRGAKEKGSEGACG